MLARPAWHIPKKRDPFDTTSTSELIQVSLNCMEADVHTSRANGTAVPKSAKDKASSVVAMVIRSSPHAFSVQETSEASGALI